MPRGGPAPASLPILLLLLATADAHAQPAARVAIDEFAAVLEAPASPLVGSQLALPLETPQASGGAVAPSPAGAPNLGSERARILLQSLTIPNLQRMLARLIILAAAFDYLHAPLDAPLN